MNDLCSEIATSSNDNGHHNNKISENHNGTTKSENSDGHYHPSVRLVHVQKLENGSCGFNLSRSKWDPYPWVSQVDDGSPAESHGVKNGDCVLEVNGEDIIGMRISDVASHVRAKPDHVTLLLWTTGIDMTCNTESLCCGPMPQNLERLSASVSTILAALECPVCLDTIPPPCIQCLNGHLICAPCSLRSEKCPVCREKYSPGRSWIAEQIFTTISQAFKLCETESKLREKLFGAAKCKKLRRDEYDVNIGKPIKSHAHTFLAKIMGKSSSVDNLTTKKYSNGKSDEGMLKTKSLSLSTSEIFHADPRISGPGASGPVSNQTSNNELASLRPVISSKRPRSCNVSTEHINRSSEDVIQLIIPAKAECQLFHCPYGEHCKDKLKAVAIQQHTMENHKVPIITFGSASAEISLPPKSPVENASLLLHKDTFLFWLRLDCAENGDIFTSALIQGSKTDAEQYVLEVSITNVGDSKIHRKELIARNEIFDLEAHSWMSILNARNGIFYARESLNATFNTGTEIVLRAKIIKVDDI